MVSTALSKTRMLSAFMLAILIAAAVVPFMGAASAATPSITVTSPSAGASWAGGSQHTITWTSDSVTGMVEIKLRRGGYTGTEEVDIANNILNTGWYNWTVPAGLAAASDYYIGVEAKSLEGVKGYSQAFSITGGTSGGLQIMSLSSDEAWEENSTHSISISGCTPGETYELKLMKGGVVVDNLTSFTATGSTAYVDWKVDSSVGDNYRLAVMNSNGSKSAVSASTFHVSASSTTSNASDNSGIIAVVVVAIIVIVVIVAVMLARKKK